MGKPVNVEQNEQIYGALEISYRLVQFAHALSIDHDKKAGGGWAAGLEWPSYSWGMSHARQINRCILQYPHRRLIGVPAPDFRRSLVRRHHPGATQGGACRRTRGSADTHHAYRVSSHRCHPARRSSSGLVVALPTRHSSAAPAARLHTPVSSRDCTTLAGGPAFTVSKRLIRLGFRGRYLPGPRRISSSLDQSSFASRPLAPREPTAVPAPFVPFFPHPNPLSSGVLTNSCFSAHFQGCQALQALASSYSPHAFTGNYTLKL